MSQVLDDARKLVQFDVKELSYMIWDGKNRQERQQRFQKLCNDDPILKNDPRSLGIGRKELYDLYCAKARRILEIAPLEDIKEFATDIFPEPLVSSLNYEMFMPTIKNLGTDEQVKLFWEPARRWEIMGCYAQTEIAHGSDMNRIETTATFDKVKQDFVVNTPNLGATKWWGSDLGLTSTHACTHAQLIVDGKNYGVQNFIIQIRDIKTHEPLQGIKLGDIGPKFGFNAKDNGFVRFDNIRIPKVNMLSRYVNLAADGTFTKTGNDKIWYATMQLQRQHFLDVSYKSLGQALTIISRYSLQRTQFKDKNQKEIPVFNYQLQQSRIVPMIAEMYGQMFGSKRILSMAQENVKQIKEKDNFSLMEELHVVLSSAKAYYTWNTYFGLERLRQCAGGHGYSLYSGLPQILTGFAACVTAEGDNTVLSLSAAKGIIGYLTKSLKSGKAPNSSVDYLQDVIGYVSDVKQTIHTREDLNDLNKLREILRYNVAFNVANAGQQLQALMKEKKISFKEATDKHLGIVLNEITRAQSNYWTMKVFVEELSLMKDKKIAAVLSKVCQFYGLMKIMETQISIFEFGIMEPEHFKWVKDARDDLLPVLKEQAIGLCEAFGYSDDTLRTAIGRHDGKPYETLFKWSSEFNSVNDPEFQEELFQKLKPQRDIIQGPKL